MICSPTAFALASPAEITSILLVFADWTSIFSRPEPTLAINFKFVAFLIKVLSIGILLLIMRPEYLCIFFSISVLFEIKSISFLKPISSNLEMS